LVHSHYCFFLYFFTSFLGSFDRGRGRKKKDESHIIEVKGRKEIEGGKNKKETVSAFAFLRYSALLHSALPPCSVLFCRGVYGDMLERVRLEVEAGPKSTRVQWPHIPHAHTQHCPLRLTSFTAFYCYYYYYYHSTLNRRELIPPFGDKFFFTLTVLSVFAYQFFECFDFLQIFFFLVKFSFSLLFWFLADFLSYPSSVLLIILPYRTTITRFFHYAPPPLLLFFGLQCSSASFAHTHRLLFSPVLWMMRMMIDDDEADPTIFSFPYY